MKAMLLRKQMPVEHSPLSFEELPIPVPNPQEVLIQVQYCGVCRTDLHVIEGDLSPQTLPLVPGHQIVGTVVERGSACTRLDIGSPVGVAWLGSTCGRCEYCVTGKENLCPRSGFTGYHYQGGYAEYTTARENFVYPLSKEDDLLQTSPLLCAGIIGYRALKRSRFTPGHHLGLFGFGSSAHIVIQLALAKKGRVSVITRSQRHQELAKSMGAHWASGSIEGLPSALDSAILFAPAGELVPLALSQLKRGGTVAVAGIHLSEIPPLDYERHLFYEKELRSVTANTRQDGQELLTEARQFGVKAQVTVYDLKNANEALQDLKMDRISGTAVLKI